MLGGCGPSQAEIRAFHGVQAYYAGDFRGAVERFRPLADKTDQNFVLNNCRLGSAALADYDLDSAESAFLKAYEVINSVGVAIIIFLAAMQILPLIGLDIKPLLASAGIAGLAIGFGAQTLVKDVINGFFILLEDQYHLGDVVQISGVKGTVEDMSLRRTALRDGDGTLHFIPNSEIKVVSRRAHRHTDGVETTLASSL